MDILTLDIRALDSNNFMDLIGNDLLSNGFSIDFNMSIDYDTFEIVDVELSKAVMGGIIKVIFTSNLSKTEERARFEIFFKPDSYNGTPASMAIGLWTYKIPSLCTCSTLDGTSARVKDIQNIIDAWRKYFNY